MARGRMVSATLGRSKKYNQLPDHFAKLVYVHALTTADEQGRIEADPVNLYGDHFVLDPEATFDRIDAALQAMHEVGLIRLYEVDGKRYAQFADFHKHNDIRRDKNGKPEREGVSRIPAPPDDCAETAQSPRSNRAASAQRPRSDRADVVPEGKGKGKDEDQDEDARASARAAPPPETPPDDRSSEARFDRRMRAGQRPEVPEENRVRATLRRLAGADFARDNEDSLTAWSHWTDADLRRLWDASDLTNWPKERAAGKWREWIFKDLLREKRHLPEVRAYDEVDGGDLLGVGTLTGNWGPS